MTVMKQCFLTLAALVLLSGVALAAPLGTNARNVIPKNVQQIISVDYRALRDSPSGMALKGRVMPDNLKEFEKAIKGMGVDPDKDMDQLVFVLFRQGSSLRSVGIAQGNFQPKSFVARMRTKKVKPEMYDHNAIYPTGSGLLMTFLDPNTMVFGDLAAMKNALDVYDSQAEGIGSNASMSGMIADVQDGPVWSVLDQDGTQNMMKSSLGSASSLADYDTIKKRLLGSEYTVDFSNGVRFNLTVLTSDTMTAATLSSLIQAGMMYKRLNATPAEKVALDGMTVDSNSGKLLLNFKADDQKFQALLNTDLFSTISR